MVISSKSGKRGRKQIFYVCSGRRFRGNCTNKHGVPANDLLKSLLAEMRRRFLNPAALAALIEQTRQDQQEPDL